MKKKDTELHLTINVMVTVEDAHGQLKIEPDMAAQIRGQLEEELEGMDFEVTDCVPDELDEYPLAKVVVHDIDESEDQP